MKVRVWFEAAYFGVDGIVLRRTDGAWSGIYLHGVSREPDFKKYEEPLQPPRSGWNIAWQNFVNAGLLTMPDASQVGCNVFGRDGAVLVFETNVNRTYRFYVYDNSMFAECAQSKEVLKLIDAINQEFGLKWPTTG